MPALVRIDRIDDLETEETFGAVTRLHRRIRVLDFPTGQDVDYTILLTALTEAGIPAYGSQLPALGNIFVARRSARVVEQDKVVDVDLFYEAIDSDGQSFQSPVGGVLIAEVETTLNQVQSDLDIDGNPITLSFLYPATDPNYPGQTITQGGSVQVFTPQETRRVRGIKQTPFPWLVSQSITNTTNGQTFLGNAVGTWLCTACRARAADMRSPLRWFFTYEFQFNSDGWDPQVRFLDDVTNKPPVGLVQGLGFKTVRKYRQTNFEAIIGAKVMGG